MHHSSAVHVRLLETADRVNDGVESRAVTKWRRFAAAWFGDMQYLARILVGSTIVLGQVSTANAEAFLSNQNWEIELSDHGYSDILLDNRPGFEGREYLSGEWAGAVAYTVGGTVVAPTWYEPDFIFPDWTTNSNFAVVSPIAATGSFNSDGFGLYTSRIANAHLQVDMTFQMRDSVTGVEQGTAPAGVGGSGSSMTSTPYVLIQEHTITNISGQAITDLQAFQFLHSLEAQTAVYDDRAYGGAFGAYHYDITQQGTSVFPTFDPETFEPIDFYEHFDTITLNSMIEPAAWGVGYYGVDDPISGVDDHVLGKPSTGIHLSVEGNSLDNSDAFSPNSLWVSGAQRFDLIDLDVGESVTYDVLLSLQTQTSLVPLPPAVWLFASSLLGLIGIARRNRKLA